MTRDYGALARYLAERQAAPFAFGDAANDCISHAAGAIVAQIGGDPLKDLSWSTELGAARVIKKLGGIDAAISARLRPIAPAHAHRGDIGAVPGPYLGGFAIVVVDAARLVGPGRMFAPRAAMTLAWSID